MERCGLGVCCLEFEAGVGFPGKGPTGPRLHCSSTQVLSADGMCGKTQARGRAEKGHAFYILAAEIDKKYGNDLFVCFVFLR